MANSFKIFSLVKKNCSQKVIDDNCLLFFLILILLLDTSPLSLSVLLLVNLQFCAERSKILLQESSEAKVASCYITYSYGHLSRYSTANLHLQPPRIYSVFPGNNSLKMECHKVDRKYECVLTDKVNTLMV
jgi:hypothetical protein